MARSKNSLTDVSAASGQLKSSFSNLERSQLDALKQTSGSLGNGAGNINGSVVNALQNLSYRDRSKLEIGGLFAEGLEKAGNTRKGSGAIISSVVGSSIDNRKPFYRNTPNNEIDLSISSNRVPDPTRKSPQKLMKEKRESLVGRDDLNYNGIKFPNDIEDRAHAYLALKLYDYKRPGSFVEGSLTPTVTIYLPLPENFTQEFAVNYGEQETGTFGQALAVGGEEGADALSKAVSGIQGGKSLAATAVDTIKEIDFGKTGRYSGFSTLSSASPVIGGLAGQEFGEVANPHPSLFLQGVNLRQYNLSWKLVPRSPEESETIQNILSTIKRECLPKKKDGFLTYPQMIQPEVRPKGALTGADYKKSMLGSLSINYSGEGTSAFFVDGNPVSIELTLGLQEAELYLEEVEEDDPPPLLARLQE